jgi:hypothetical protein
MVGASDGSVFERRHDATVILGSDGPRNVVAAASCEIRIYNDNKSYPISVL